MKQNNIQITQHFKTFLGLAGALSVYGSANAQTSLHLETGLNAQKNQAMKSETHTKPTTKSLARIQVTLSPEQIESSESLLKDLIDAGKIKELNPSEFEMTNPNTLIEILKKTGDIKVKNGEVSSECW